MGQSGAVTLRHSVTMLLAGLLLVSGGCAEDQGEAADVAGGGGAGDPGPGGLEDGQPDPDGPDPDGSDLGGPDSDDPDLTVPDPDDPGSGEPQPPGVCDPAPAAVPKLLRLSNHEYRSIVEDLLGEPVPDVLFQRWTPVAEVYGFDTMSETRVDAQALQVQLDTVGALARLALDSPALTRHCPPAGPPQGDPPCEVAATYSSLDDYSDVQGRRCWNYLDSSGAPMIFDNARGLWRKEPDQTALLWREGAHPGSTVDAVRRWEAPVNADVRITGRFASADPGGGDGIFVSIRHNGEDVFTRDLPNTGATEFDLTVAVGQRDRLDFVVNRKSAPSWDTTAFEANVEVAPASRRAGWTWQGCGGPLVTHLASRGFRRPVRPEELSDYEALYSAAHDGAVEAGFAEPVEEALIAVLSAVLLSPNLVFKPELVPGGSPAEERSYARASRLALFATGSLPDERLWSLAAAGALIDDDALRLEAGRLLTSRPRRFATIFGGQWLAFRDLAVDAELAAAMRRESLDVFSAVLRDGLDSTALLQPGFTLVDDRLAEHYGLSLPVGGRAPFRLLTDRRGGVLAQGSFLVKTGAGSEFRRPIHRGLWVLTRLLCRSVPRADAATLEEISASFEAIDTSLPLPEQMAQHRSSDNRCGGCHAAIDPVGLALEKFDRDGRWRQTYEDGAPIVTELELDGVVVRDPDGLAAALVEHDEYPRCVATKLFTFALNRGPSAAERCVSAQLAGDPARPPALSTMAVDAFVRGLQLTEAEGDE